MKEIIVGSRRSALALIQTGIVINKLKELFPGYKYTIKEIVTSGDANQHDPLSDISVKNLFVKEIEAELLEGKIDLAVHSMKDMPNILPRGLVIGAIPDREDRRDALISRNGKNIHELEKDSIVGTGSLRRNLQIKNLRSDLDIRDLHGNIHTRIGKLDEGEYDAIVLAAAGLLRAGLRERITQYFTDDEMMCAPCQGALCIEVREDDKFIRDIVSKINNEDISKTALAEKEFSKIFDGGCKTPICASASIVKNQIELSGLLFVDGKQTRGAVTGNVNDPSGCAKSLAEIIRSKMNG